MHTRFENFTVLVCDDSITNVSILDKLISTELSANVTTLTDPRRVVPTLLEHRHDILLLDLEMPYLNGLQVLSVVRQNWHAEKLPVVILTGAQGTETRHMALQNGANDFINKPFDQIEVCLRVKNLLCIKRSFNIQQKQNRELERKVLERTEQLNLATDALIHRLALAGEMRDNETGQHVVRVGKYARILADAIGLPKDIAFMLEKTAPLHDIGKIGIPDYILLKEGRLTDEERKVMMGHTHYGAELLGEHPSLMIQMAASIALNHHEKWDGKGYPNGKCKEAIPIEGRITSIADVFDALTTDRSYKKAWAIDKVLAFMKEEAGKSFDPKMIGVFFENLDQFIAVRQKYSG